MKGNDSMIKTDMVCADCGETGLLRKVNGSLLCSHCAVKRYEKHKLFMDAIDSKIRKGLGLEVRKP